MCRADGFLLLCSRLLGVCRTDSGPRTLRLMSGLQDFFDAEEGNRESFDYNKPSSSTANPLYGRDGESQTSRLLGAG